MLDYSINERIDPYRGANKQVEFRGKVYTTQAVTFPRMVSVRIHSWTDTVAVAVHYYGVLDIAALWWTTPDAPPNTLSSLPLREHPPGVEGLAIEVTRRVTPEDVRKWMKAHRITDGIHCDRVDIPKVGNHTKGFTDRAKLIRAMQIQFERLFDPKFWIPVHSCTTERFDFEREARDEDEKED